jgi:hypothetical protein
MRTRILLLLAAMAIAGCSSAAPTVTQTNDQRATAYSSSPQLNVCLNVHGVDPEKFMNCVRESHSATPGIECTNTRERPAVMRCVGEETGRQGLQTTNCQELFGAACTSG